MLALVSPRGQTLFTNTNMAQNAYYSMFLGIISLFPAKLGY